MRLSTTNKVIFDDEGKLVFISSAWGKQTTKFYPKVIKEVALFKHKMRYYVPYLLDGVYGIGTIITSTPAHSKHPYNVDTLLNTIQEACRPWVKLQIENYYTNLSIGTCANTGNLDIIGSMVWENLQGEDKTKLVSFVRLGVANFGVRIYQKCEPGVESWVREHLPTINTLWDANFTLKDLALCVTGFTTKVVLPLNGQVHANPAWYGLLLATNQR